MNALTTVDQKPKMMLVEFMADKYAMTAEGFSKTVRATCGMPNATAEQFAAFLVVAKEYNLNPLTKEIYAFPGRGGIVPIVSIDGWVNLVNSHGACDGFEFDMQHDDKGDPVSCTCKIYRKDRKHPIAVTEYLAECIRPTEPWKMKHRMLRHKSFIQAARYAFGYSGIYDEDEAERIAGINGPVRDSGPPSAKAVTHAPAEDEATDDSQIIDGVVVEDADTEQSGMGFDEPAGPKSEEPFAISTTGEKFGTWADKYIAKIGASVSPKEVWAWLEKNQPTVDRIAQDAPDIYAKIKSATEKHLQRLRETTVAKDADKPKAAPKPRAPRAKKTEAIEPDADAPSPENPEKMLEWIDSQLARVEKAEDLETVWNEKIDPIVDKMFPPDREEAQGIYKHHEKRLEP